MTHEDRIAQILGAWQEQRDEGQFVDPEVLYAQHPDLAGELRLRIAALNIVEQAYVESRMLEGSAPRRLGEFDIKRELGRGGMGVVYEAVQTTMKRTVALKVLFPGVTSSRRAVERFQREARAAGRVQHTNIVPVYSLGRHEDTWYFAMELVQGSSLSTILHRLRALGDELGDAHRTALGTRAASATPASESAAPTLETATTDLTGSHRSLDYHRDVAHLFAGVSDALQAAHDANVIHRDVKPSNLILDEKGVLKIVDFGIARIAGEASGMTMTGELLGTPIYMSPEQARGAGSEVDARTDVYSLGASLYEALTLRPPFQGKTFGDVYEQVITTDPATPRQRNRSVPRDLETIVLKAMDKEPRKRYGSAGAMGRDLRAFAEGGSIGARRISLPERLWRKAKRHKALATAATLLVGVVLAAVVLARRADDEGNRRRTAEYNLLVRRAAERLPSDHAAGYTRGGAAAEAFGRAIALQPQRVEAFLGRSLAGGRTNEQRLADVDAAAARGIAPSTAARLRALFLHSGGRAQEALAIESGLRDPEPSDLFGTYAAGLRAAQRADSANALLYLGRVIDQAPPTSLVAYVARRQRASVFAQAGLLNEALDDLHATRAQGDRGPDTAVRIASLWRRLKQADKAEQLVAETLAPGHNDLPAWDVLIRACLAQRERTWAERGARQAIKEYPKDGVLRALLGRALALDSRWAESIEQLRAAVDLAPESGLAHALLALSLGDTGKAPEALELSERALSLAPNDPWVRLIRAGALRSAGKHEEAFAAAAEVLQRDPTRSGAMRLQGLIRQDQKRLDDALPYFEGALRLEPGSARAQRDLGILQFRRGNPAEAQRALERAVELAPGVAKFHYDLGVLHNSLGDHEASLACYRRALALKADYASAAYNLAHSLANLKHWKEALAAYKQVVPLNAKYPGLWMEIGNCHWALKDLEAANDAYEQALKVRPGNLEVRANKASILNSMGRRKDAIREFDAILDKRPDLGAVWHNKALAHRALGEIEKALDAFTEAGKQLPGDPEPHLNRGELLGRLKRHEEEMEAYRQAIAMAPSSPNARYNLALTLARKGRFADARKEIEACIDVAPGYAMAHNLLGQLQTQALEHEEAVRSLKKAVEMAGRFEHFHNDVARALMRANRFPEAADGLSQAARLFQQKARPSTWLALVLTSAPDPSVWAPQPALEAARHALTCKDATPLSRLALALALHRCKRYREALGELTKARAKGDLKPVGVLIEALVLQAQGEIEAARTRLASIEGEPDPADKREQADLGRRLRTEAERLLEGE